MPGLSAATAGARGGDLLASDHGTTSTRAAVLDAAGRPLGAAQLKHRRQPSEPGLGGARSRGDAMAADPGARLRELRVDGGMAVNDLLLQIESDQLGLPVLPPDDVESTARGAAYAASLAAGVWPDLNALGGQRRASARFEPGPDETWRRSQRCSWRDAVNRSLNWPGGETT